MKFLKFKIVGLIIVLATSFFGCTKEDVTPSYNLRFTCTSKNPYLVEVNGTSNVLQGNTYKDYKLKKGTYAWKVTQQSGYLIYPTVQTGTTNLDQDKEVVFP